jgi:hypothetical protein
MFLDDPAPHILTQRPAMSTVKKNVRSSSNPTRKGQELFDIAFEAVRFSLPNF